jgi:glutamate carboxypeptidase
MPLLSVEHFSSKLPDMLNVLRSFVEIESPTDDKNAVDQLGRSIAEKAQQLDAQIRRFPQNSSGDHWSFQWGTAKPGFLILAHMDTVYPLGTLEEMPLIEKDGKLFGPGVLDMKAGIVIALSAISSLMETNKKLNCRITLLCTSDEETGSTTSRTLIEQLAGQHELVLCLEPALSDGSLKTWRKGTGLIRIETFGRSAHAGSEPELGVNAILEMTYQLQKIAELADAEAGTTISVGRIQGGTRSNVVPEQCKSIIDVRIKKPQEQMRLDKALSKMKPVLNDAQVRIQCEWNRPPMVRNNQMRATFARAKSIAAELGIQLSEGGTGGGSDANFVASLGVPVLDGLGAIGEGAHSRNEYISISSLPERAALLAALISAW